MEPDAFALAVQRLAEEAAGQSQHLYWLLDQSALPPPPWLSERLGKTPVLNLLTGDEQPDFDGATPLLVPAPADTRRTRSFAETLHRVAAHANAVCVLVSGLPPQTLRHELAQRARIMLPQNMPALLRFFDTRTLPQLPHILEPAQYAALRQPTAAWHYLDRWGVLQQLPAARADATAPLPLALSPAQEQALVDDGLADAVIDLLITQRHPVVQDKTPPQQYEWVRPIVDAALAMGLGEPPQAMMFVAKAAEHGTDFHTREPWAGNLLRFRQGQCTWHEALA